MGWVLRDVSVHHPDQVIVFLRKHKMHWSKEGLRYAMEKMNSEQKARVKAASDDDDEDSNE